MIWVHDADGNLLFINQAYRDFYHIADGEISGDRWQDLVHPEDCDRYPAEFAKSTETRTLFHAEARVRSDAGEWRWIESWGQPRLSDEGEFLGYVGNSVDVTTRKLNEAQLEQALADLEVEYDGKLPKIIESDAKRLVELVAELTRSEPVQ